MTSQDRLSIIITFVFGMVCGGYLYLTGFATTFSLPEVGQETVYRGFVVTADSYGACEQENTCLSFQLLENGSYRAIFDSTGAKVVVEEEISGLLRRDLSAVLLESELQSQAIEKTTPTCYYGEAATNYRFNITLNGTDYFLDTCRSAIDYDGIVWNTLIRVWAEIVS